MKELSRIRKSRGLTQVQLAEMAGIDQATISKIERDPLYNFTAEMLRKLSSALRVEPAALIGLPDLQARAIAALQAIDDPERRAAALTVLETMAGRRNQ